MFITLLNPVFLFGWESAYFLKGLFTGVPPFSFIVAVSTMIVMTIRGSSLTSTCERVDSGSTNEEF